MRRILLACLLAGCQQSKPSSAPPAGLEAAAAAAERPGPLLIIGVDALDLDVIGPLAKAGKVPNLDELMRRGAHGVLFSENEMRSPALWTTIATGRPRSVHGIYDFVTGSRLWPERKRGGPQKLVTSGMRKAPALWNMASEAGLKVAVVGWLNTWPAETVNGTMVSPYVALGKRKQITIKGGIYAEESDQVAPPERWELVRPLIVEAEDVGDDMLRRLANPLDEQVARALPIVERQEAAMRWSLAHTLTVQAVGLRLLAEDRPDLAMVYFEGSDSLAHRFWLFRQPREKVEAVFREVGLPVEHLDALRAAYGEVVSSYYHLVDEAIGSLVRALPEGGRVLVVSDHGFTDRSERYPVNPAVPFAGEHRLEGTIVLAGPGIGAGGRFYGATLYDVVPTALRLLELEVDLPFEGQSLVSHVEAEEGDSPGEPLDAPFADSELERLRSLGYVQ